MYLVDIQTEAPAEGLISQGHGPQDGGPMDEHTISPAGDPFSGAPDQPPHACLGGYVYIGRTVAGEDGDDLDIVEAVPCRRCADGR